MTLNISCFCILNSSSYEILEKYILWKNPLMLSFSIKKPIERYKWIVIMYLRSNSIFCSGKIYCHGAILNNIDIESATWIGFTQSPLKQSNRQKIINQTSSGWKGQLGATSKTRLSFSLDLLRPSIQTSTLIIWVHSQ